MKKRTAPFSASHTIRIAAFATLAITTATAASLLIWPDPPAGDPPGPSRPFPTPAGGSIFSNSVASVSATTPGGDPAAGSLPDPSVPLASGLTGKTRPFPPVISPMHPAGGEGSVITQVTRTPDSNASLSGGTTGTQPRYANEVSQLLSRIETAGEALASSRFYLGFYEVDAANPTSMIVLADTKERADNLDGFFRLGVDLDGETWGNAPLAIGLARLYTDSGRDRAFADGSFCSDGLDSRLGDALAVLLGDAYQPGMLAFILEEYRAGMESRVLSDGSGRTGYRAVAPFPGWDIVFNDGYVTFVEFYPGSSPLKP